MCIKRLPEKFVHKALLVFEIYSFEVHYRSDSLLWKGRSKQNESTNVSISKLIIGTKPKRFDLVRLLSEQKQNVFNLFQNYLKSNRNVLAFFKVQKRSQNETELISYWIETFPYTYASKETKRNFCELFPNFSTSSERFCLLQAA
jgi:hypothetical protein